MSRKLTKYSKEYKLSFLREYYSSEMTKYSFEKEHNLAPATFLRWLSAYESEKNCLPLQGRTEQPGFCVSSKTNMSRISVRHLRLCLLIQYGCCRTVYCFSYKKEKCLVKSGKDRCWHKRKG